jgi:membrane protease YdiL (CAAX protease family)
MTKLNNNAQSIIISKAILFCTINTGLLRLSLFITSTIPGLSNNFLTSTIGPILTLLITYLFLKFDKKSFSSIGLKFESATLKRFCIGFLIGLGMISVYVLCIAYFSDFKIQPNKDANIFFILFPSLPVIIILAFTEEIVFRGYPLITLKNKIGTIAALVITSLLFGLYHLAFGWGITGFFSTTIWGLIFGLSAIYSNGISMSTGLHSAANLTQLIFGITGSSYSIWNVVYRDGRPVKNFLNNPLSQVIVDLILLTLVIICIKWVLRNRNYR